MPSAPGMKQSLNATANFESSQIEHISSHNSNTNGTSASLNLVSHQRRQLIGTPKKPESTGNAKPNSSTNLEQLNAFLRNGAAANKMR